MSKIIVLGAGMVGSAIAIDLANTHEVAIADIKREALDRAASRCGELETMSLNVSDEAALTDAVAGRDLVINAVPGFLGYGTLSSVIKAGRDVIDIAFFPENALELDQLAKENQVTAIVDCGLAPGMSNLLLGHYDARMKISHFECLVGGLPRTRKWPFAYKAPFSPVDVIEEYTRPSRYVENGVVVTREALSDCEYVEFDKPGTLEAFNTDGLRTLIQTLPHIPNMKEKTLRYPGHAEYVKVLKESGFFSKVPRIVSGTAVTPLEFTSGILFDEWKLGGTEEELTVFRVTLKGEDPDGREVEVVCNMYDEYCRDSGTSSMARTTGYAAAAAARLVLEGGFREKGIFPPELVGRNEACFEFVMKYLEERNIHYIRESRLL
jgi:lysine 6-dehydrogenase